MFESIIYLPKKKQASNLSKGNLFWGCFYTSGNNRFGYKGNVTFCFDGDRLCRLDLSDNYAGLKNASDKQKDKVISFLQNEKEPLDIVLYGTEFQHKVWKSLLKIPTGKTVFYSFVADSIKKPKAVRAVGTAIGSNPISLIIPCHRVVNKDSKKISYGWGADIKTKLLEFEKLQV